MFCRRSEEEIRGLFHAYAPRDSVVPAADEIVDWFGMRIPIHLVPYMQARVGTRIDHPPYPTDGFRASYIEYLAVLESIDQSGDTFAMAEVGASYAPFAALCGCLAVRRGARQVYLRAVEAGKNAHEVIRANYARNGLLHRDDVDVFTLNAAVDSSFKTVFFPDIDCVEHNGCATQESASAPDLYGAHRTLIPVQAVPLDCVLALFPKHVVIDLLHIDIQGTERTALPAAITSMTERVKRVMVGTHSRQIEGELIELFSRAGWELVAEEPCEFVPRPEAPRVEGWICKDGSQYWINRSLA